MMCPSQFNKQNEKKKCNFQRERKRKTKKAKQNKIVTFQLKMPKTNRFNITPQIIIIEIDHIQSIRIAQK